MKLTITLELEPDFEGFKVKLNGQTLEPKIEPLLVDLPYKTCNKKCLECGKEFTCTSNAQKFCSEECKKPIIEKSKVKVKAHKAGAKKLKETRKVMDEVSKMVKTLKPKPEPIEKTLAEVEENQRRREATPYEFNT